MILASRDEKARPVQCVEIALGFLWAVDMNPQDREIMEVSAELKAMVNGLLQHDGEGVPRIRVTDGEPRRGSVIDYLRVVTGQSADSCNRQFRRIVSAHPAVEQMLSEHKFPGARQRKTWVADAPGLISLHMLLPAKYSTTYAGSTTARESAPMDVDPVEPMGVDGDEDDDPNDAPRTPCQWLFQGRHPVRVFMRNGDPWFIAKDVCDVLELGNNRDACSRLRDDERGYISTEERDLSVLAQSGQEKANVGTGDVTSRKRRMCVISESGLYRLIFTSRVEMAEVFRSWVTRDVIPTIRKTGKYVITGGVTGGGNPICDEDYVQKRCESADKTNVLNAAIKTHIKGATRDLYVNTQGAISDALMGQWPKAFKRTHGIPDRNSARDCMTKEQLAGCEAVQAASAFDAARCDNDAIQFNGKHQERCRLAKIVFAPLHGQYQDPTELPEVRRASRQAAIMPPAVGNAITHNNNNYNCNITMNQQQTN